jgi:hypothetical protein
MICPSSAFELTAAGKLISNRSEFFPELCPKAMLERRKTLKIQEEK